MSSGHATGHVHLPGVTVTGTLPDPAWQDRWDDIVVDPGIKSRLLGHALFCLTQRGGLSRVRLPVHGLSLLAGPPGTGKTTLVHGLAHTAALILRERQFAPETLFAVVDPHAFPSEFLGESQRAVGRLFKETLPELAAEGKPVVVLVDEVEALAVTRHEASFATNPVDVHRATAAVLTGLDVLSADNHNVLVVATTNEPSAIDAAFLSRVDLVETFELPGVVAVEHMLRSTLREVGTGIVACDEELSMLAERCVRQGMDARQVRKAVLRAVVGNGPDVAIAPDSLTLQHVITALG
jgi:pachytene checkpoint protein 2